MELAVKLYACCAFLHPALDGVLALLEEGAVAAEDVTAITLRFSHSGRSMIDQNELKSHRAQYILPIGLYNRKVVLDDILFEPPRYPHRRRSPSGRAWSATTTWSGSTRTATPRSWS